MLTLLKFADWGSFWSHFCSLPLRWLWISLMPIVCACSYSRSRYFVHDPCLGDWDVRKSGGCRNNTNMKTTPYQSFESDPMRNVCARYAPSEYMFKRGGGCWNTNFNSAPEYFFESQLSGADRRIQLPRVWLLPADFTMLFHQKGSFQYEWPSV